MPKRPPRFTAPPAVAPKVDGEMKLTPEMLGRQEFARRLQALMLSKHMNQSQLAKKAFGTTLDRRGYEVPLGKDSLSSYLAAKRTPGTVKGTQLAEALGVSVEELFPNGIAYAAKNEHLSFSMRELAGHPGRVWVTLDRMLPTTLALKIAVLVNEADEDARVVHQP